MYIVLTLGVEGMIQESDVIVLLILNNKCVHRLIKKYIRKQLIVFIVTSGEHFVALR